MTPTPTVVELRRESERSRAELSDTVENLRHKITDTAEDIRQRVSPERIKGEVSDYVSEKGRHWFDALKQHAMDNPMQTLAAGTAIAVPAFKMIRSVPLPLLMIGAGLALTSSRVRGAVSDKVSEALTAPDGGNAIDAGTGIARDGWQSARNRAEEAADQTRRGLHDAQDAVSHKIAEVGDSATQMAGEAKNRAVAYGAAAKEALGATASTAGEAAKDALETTRASVAATFGRTRSSAESLVGNNAALVGGIGLAIGALIAASLPSTRIEGDAMGSASDALRGSAAETVNEKFDEVTTAAMSAAESAAGKISDAALGSDVSHASAKAAEGLRTITDEAITTAFEPTQSDHR